MKSLLFLFFTLIHTILAIDIYPDSSYNQTTASSRACFSNCQFCQIKTGYCEECLSPYFQKNAEGKCMIKAGYSIDSADDQLYPNLGFDTSRASWNLHKTLNCSPDPMFYQIGQLQEGQVGLRILGPFSKTQGIITYQRSLSRHKYIKVKIFFLKMNWTQGDSLNILLKDQNNITLENQTIFSSANVPNENLCSGTTADQRYSLSFDLINQNATKATKLLIDFTSNFTQEKSTWGIGTLLVLTGNCNQLCDECDTTEQIKSCKRCKNFLVEGLEQPCSRCPQGFRIKGSKCFKCPIEYKTCQSMNNLCFYSNLQNQLFDQNCTWNNNKHYKSLYDLENYFVTTYLFSLNEKWAQVYLCGQYSVVGLASKGESVTRIFQNLSLHQSVSLSFNLMVVDQGLSQRSIFQIYIDNVRVQSASITMIGISNTCGGSKLEAFQTYPATKFFPHTNMKNVNITIRSPNTGNWGIRDFRLSLHVCDETCLSCGPNGCLTCKGYFGLSGISCSQCPKGSSKSFNTDFCYQCSDNCLQCLMQSSRATPNCTKCQQGYFKFEGRCQKLVNVGQDVNTKSINWLSGNPKNIEGECTIKFQSVPQNSSKVSFQVASQSLLGKFSVPEPHYKILLSFYLLKIDNWPLDDELHLYINDLLVLRKSYDEFGNRICYNQSQNDRLTFEEIQIADDNTTVNVFFEVVSKTAGSKRLFGVANLNVNPVGCSECLNYDFNYKVQYNYDETLKVQVIFNRIYINNDPNLFKQIFVLQVNNQKITYQLIRNDSIHYVLEAYVESEVLLENITVICLYPEKVTADIQNPVSKEAFFQTRILQETQIMKLKALSNNVSSKIVKRFTPLNESKTAHQIATFFQVITRMVIYVGFFSFFIGCLTPCTHFMHNIQKIWLHIYVASMTIPNFLKYCLKGFRQSQDQNIAINPSGWQKELPNNLYYEAPPQYQDYYKDITFYRNIYNIAFAAGLYLTFSVVMYLVFKFLSKKIPPPQTKFYKFIWHMKLTFYRRPFFVLNSVIFYQYLAVCVACTLQFIDLKSKTNVPYFPELNAASAILAFILITIYPIFQFYYLSYKEEDMYGINYQISYRNRYHQIFFRFLPKNLWKVPNFELEPIGFKQRIYNLIRFGQLWWIAIIVALMYKSPFAQVFLLLIFNSLHIAFLWISSISSTRTFKFLKVFELLFFGGLQIIMLVTLEQNKTLTKEAYTQLGFAGVAFLFIILGLSFIRFIYTFMRIVGEYNVDKANNRVDERLRSDDCYGSFQGPQKMTQSEQ